MTRTALALRAFVVCIALGSGVSSTAAGLRDDPDVASQLNLLDAWIRTQMDYSGVPGMVIGIVHDQEIVSLRAYGWADLERKALLRTDAIFRIASQSKLFTAVAAMQLCDAGRLQLDEPIRKQLGWFRLKTSFPDSPGITLRHLLTHSAGVPREAAFPYWTEHEFPTVENVVARIAEQETVYPVSTTWKYSNLGMAVVGLLVEKAAGRPYRDQVQAQILTPLGMSSTSIGVPPPEHRDRLVTGHGRRMPDGSRERLPFIDARGMDPAAGFSSSVPDMLRFISWQMRLHDGDKTEILRASTLREMQRVQFLREDWKSGWGFGFGITHTPDRDLVGHGGAYPGHFTVAQLSPSEKVGVVVFTNATASDPGHFARRAFEWVAPALVKAAKGAPKAPQPDPAWQAYVGTYRSRWGDTKVLVLGGKLTAISPLDEDFLEAKLVLVPAGGHTFRIEGKGSGPRGELARFEVDASGKVRRLFLGQSYTTRLDPEGPADSESM